MKAMNCISFHFRISIFLLFMLHSISISGKIWECRILPSERKLATDQASGARITFITTDKSDDRNLYFHDRCWMLDPEVLLFTFYRDDDLPASNPVASKKGNSFYIVKGCSIYNWLLGLELVPETRAVISESKICDFPELAEPIHSLNENTDGTLVSYG
jgi:hypothetical protein